MVSEVGAPLLVNVATSFGTTVFEVQLVCSSQVLSVVPVHVPDTGWANVCPADNTAQTRPIVESVLTQVEKRFTFS
jgi:formylmethanofuran dehydrogenase subunit D